MLSLLSTLLLRLAYAQSAPTIYSCKENKIATLQWNEGGILSKPGIDGKIDGPNNGGSTVTLVIMGKKAMFKGNNGESPLEIVDESTFLEKPLLGSYIMWKLIPGKNKVPTLLVQFKGYDLGGPYIHAWVFKCD